MIIEIFIGMHATIVADNACRPRVSVSEASWSELPPLCKYVPTRGKSSLKKNTASRWDGEEGSTTKRRQCKRQPLKLALDNIESTYEEAAPDPKGSVNRSSSPRKPHRKASIEMAPLKMPMRKASIDMSCCEQTLNRPMRKASMDFVAMDAMDIATITQALHHPILRRMSMEMACTDLANSYIPPEVGG